MAIEKEDSFVIFPAVSEFMSQKVD